MTRSRTNLGRWKVSTRAVQTAPSTSQPTEASNPLQSQETTVVSSPKRFYSYLGLCAAGRCFMLI